MKEVTVLGDDQQLIPHTCDKFPLIMSQMARASKVLYEFGPFRVDPEKQVLLRDNQPVSVTPKTFETLLVLVRHSREVVTKDYLMKELWPDSFVEEANLSQNIFMLRKALGDSPEARRYIVTLPGKGYRFTAEVRTVTEHDNVVIASRSRSEIVLEKVDRETADAPVESAAAEKRFGRKRGLALAAAVALLVVGAVFFLHRGQPVGLTAKDKVVIADFSNTTGDPVFDDTLRQGLAVQLEQSPFLQLVSDQRIQQTLRLMEKPSDVRLTPELAREVCERTGSAAVMEGSIASLGNQYVLGLRASNCQSGDRLADEQGQASRKEDILNVLSGMTARVRSRLGESLTTIEQHNVPLEKATTSSLEALQAYSIGLKVLLSTGDTAGLPWLQRAVAIDPNFAMAYAWIGRIYGDLGEGALSAESTSKAYALRERTSDQEKFWISAAYDTQVTENLDRAQQICELWAKTYPREAIPHTFLAGVIYPVVGKYEQAVQEARRAIELDPDLPIAYFLLAWRNLELGRFGEAEKALQRATERKLNIPDFPLVRHDLAFLRGDQKMMEVIAAAAKEDDTADEWVSDHRAFVLAYSGRLQEARKVKLHAVDLAQRRGHREAAALYEAGEALWEGYFGMAREAKQAANAALALSNNRGVEYGAALALALSGESARAQMLADDLGRRFPEDTSVQFSYLPTLRARLALNQGNPAKAIELLSVASGNELGSPRTTLHANFGALYPVYMRGEAYLAAHRGSEAAAEFQKILNHPGVVASDPVGAVAQLQLARAYAMQGDSAKARSAYQAFLTLWKDGQPGVPIYKAAGVEYSKLK